MILQFNFLQQYYNMINILYQNLIIIIKRIIIAPMASNLAQLADKDKQSQILDSILNNANCTLSFNNRDYIILIKRQKNKNYCTLFLTDCSDKFWIEKLDLSYCEKLKIDMNVKTKTEVFARHFVESLKNNPKIEAIQPNASLKLQIKISEGLIINCLINFTICISSEANPEQYKLLIRSFFKQLYEAKQNQIEMLKKQLQKKTQQQKHPENKSADKGYVKSVLNISQKKQAPQIPSKNRDLINPQKKKRRLQGMKIIGCD